MENFILLKKIESVNKQLSVIQYEGQKCVLKIYDSKEASNREVRILQLLVNTGCVPELVNYCDNYNICKYIEGNNLEQEFKTLTMLNNEEGLVNLAKKVCRFLQMFHSVTGQILGDVDFTDFVIDDKGSCIGISFEKTTDGLTYEDIATIIANALIESVGGTISAYPFINEVLECFHLDLMDVINEIEDKLELKNKNKFLPVSTLVEELISIKDLK